MEFSKREITRAIEELNECLNNILDANTDNYIIRLKQLFVKIEANTILNFIIKPYLSFEITDPKVGLHDSFHGRLEILLPIDDDEEISLILQILNKMKEDERLVTSIPLGLYFKKSLNENLSLFNNNIIKPSFVKLVRKLRYKIEDLAQIPEDNIDSSKVTIITIGNISANNSTIAVGQNINQESRGNLFEDIKSEINSKVQNPKDKEEILSIISEMENCKNKESFKEKYNNFLTRLGTYITIVTPFLPQLVALL